MSIRHRAIFDPVGIPRQGLVGMYLPALDPDARNLLKQSALLTDASWIETNATKDSATLLTFTAQWGRVNQSVSTIEGLSYTLSFKARRVSGNTALQFFHYQSASGDSTALTVTDTLTQYSVTVLGKTGGGSIFFGIRDPNASGFGQIEITDWQVNVGSLQPYNPTTDKATYLDRSGYNLHGALATGAAMPTWMPDSLSYDGGDYVILDTAGPVYGAGYTVLMVVKGAAVSGETAYSEGNSGAASQLLRIRKGYLTDSAKLSVTIDDNAASPLLGVVSATTAFDNTWHLVGFRDNGGAYTMFIDGVKESGSYTQGTLTLNRVTVGAKGTTAYANYFTGSLGGPLRWRHPISDAEYERTRSRLRLDLAPAGVVLP